MFRTAHSEACKLNQQQSVERVQVFEKLKQEVWYSTHFTKFSILLSRSGIIFILLDSRGKVFLNWRTVSIVHKLLKSACGSLISV